MVPKGDIAKRTMSVCTQQYMAVFCTGRTKANAFVQFSHEGER